MTRAETTRPGALDIGALDQLTAGYHQRPARLLTLQHLGDQLAKVYAVEAPGRTVDLESWHHGLGLAALALQSHRETGGLGLACVILHAGGDGDYVLAHSWVEGYMSRLAVFTGPMGDPDALRPASTGLAPCVWEAAVLAQERDAFVRHVLGGDGPLEDRMEAWSSDVLAEQSG
ncbi:MAG: hypothetical protein ACRDO0_15375 [Nocardioidaceae bacterium]